MVPISEQCSTMAFYCHKKKEILEKLSALALYGQFIKNVSVGIAVVANKKKSPKCIFMIQVWRHIRCV